MIADGTHKVDALVVRYPLVTPFGVDFHHLAVPPSGVGGGGGGKKNKVSCELEGMGEPITIQTFDSGIAGHGDRVLCMLLALGLDLWWEAWQGNGEI